VSPARGRADVLAVIAAGGALGSLARWGLGEAVPNAHDRVAWSTLTVNVSGAFLLGLLMVLVLDVWPPSRYVRPFLAVGVLGGFTTFSTYMLDTRHLLAAGEPARAAGYLFGTLLAGLVAVWLGVVTARTAAAAARRAKQDPSPTEAS
jgi:CrcB protein